MTPGGEHEWRILEIHKDEVSAVCLDSADAVGDLGLQPFRSTAPCDVVGAKLPDNEIGIVVKDIAVQTRQIAWNGVADAAAVDGLDLRLRAQPHQFTSHDLRKGRRGIEDPKARC